ncbi:MAG: hypothetical protein U0838_13745 [Chloroflexota bacterium]
MTYANVTSTLALFLADHRYGICGQRVDRGEHRQRHDRTTADIKNGTITGADVQDASLRGVDIQDGYVSAADIADNSLTGAEIADGSLTGGDIANGSINGDAKITDNTITTYDLADNSVDSDEVMTGLTNEIIGILNWQGRRRRHDGQLERRCHVRAPGDRNVRGELRPQHLGMRLHRHTGRGGDGRRAQGVLGVTDRNANVNAAFVAVRARGQRLRRPCVHAGRGLLTWAPRIDPDGAPDRRRGGACARGSSPHARGADRLGGQPNQPSGLQAPPPVAPDPGASAPQPDGKAAPAGHSRAHRHSRPIRHTIAAGPVVGTARAVERTRGGNGGVRPGRADVEGVDGGVVPDRED